MTTGEPWEDKASIILTLNKVTEPLETLLYQAKSMPPIRQAGVSKKVQDILRECNQLLILAHNIEIHHNHTLSDYHCLCSHSQGSHVKAKVDGQSYGKYSCTTCICSKFLNCECEHGS